MREVGGQVFDVFGNPAIGIVARVHLFDWSAEFTTGSDGGFSWAALYHPEYYVTLVAPDLRADDVKVTLEDGKRIIVNFREYTCDK